MIGACEAQESEVSPEPEVSQAPEVSEAPEPPPVSNEIEQYVQSTYPSSQGIVRYPKNDVGPYQAYRVKKQSSGPGSPGHSLIFAKDGKPMSKQTDDWTDFLGAAAPEQVAAGLARPLDTVLHPSGPQGEKPAHPLHKLPDTIRARIVDPQRTAEGALQFYVLDGRGDRGRRGVLYVVAAPQADGGIEITHERVKP